VDNLLKGVVDAIAESDNEIGGQRITRLREAHVHGGGNAFLLVGTPGVIETKTDAFQATDVGKLLDVLIKSPATGNQGTYTISAYVNARQVSVVNILGAAPVWVAESDVSWRFATLRVESAFEWLTRDKALRVWVGNEPSAVDYCATSVVPGAQEFLGLGAHVGGEIGEIAVATPARFASGDRLRFAAGDVGRSIWFLPSAGGSTANSGRRVIATVVDDQTVTLTGPAFTADERRVAWRMKTYADEGYLTRLQREDAEVWDGSQGYSGLDHLRRALLVEYAEAEELDRIARRHGLARPRGCPDDTWRRLLMVLPYMAKTTLHALEIALDALYPAGGWSIYEDLINHPCEVFFEVPALKPSSIYEGKAFFEEVEPATSTTSTSVPIAVAPTTVCSVKLQPTIQRLEMDVLPSADVPPWTYVNEGATEGAVFSVAVGTLFQVCPSATVNGGRYRRSVPGIRAGSWKIGGWWKLFVSVNAGGWPWKLIVRDGEREVCLFWDEDDVIDLGQADETSLEEVAWVFPSMLAAWHYFELEARDGMVYGRVNGRQLLAVPHSSFAASSSKDFSFGYVNNALAQDWTCLWDGVQIVSTSRRDYANVERTDGMVNNSLSTLSSASNPFIAGDNGRRVRLYSPRNENDGAWIATYVGAGQVSLAGELHLDEAQVETVGGISRITLRHPRWDDRDSGKSVTLAGSGTTPSNNGTFPIEEVEDEWTVVVTKPSGFVTESALDWQFLSSLWTEGPIRFEVIATSSYAALAVALRDALPAAATPVELTYTTVKSAQLVLDEFTVNKGEAGAPPLRYPFYLFDVDRLTRDIIDAITAAGVWPRYSRDD